MIDDAFVLLKWLEDLSLKAHNKAENSVTEYGKQAYTKEKEAYDRVIKYIQTMGKRSG